MGAWATAAWDNDGAADWFGDMFDATGLANYVRETLQRDVEEYDEEVRAAAYMVVALGRVYMWPIHVWITIWLWRSPNLKRSRRWRTTKRSRTSLEQLMKKSRS